MYHYLPSLTLSSIHNRSLTNRKYQHRTGCVVAITRKLQQWSNERILHEYKTFASPKVRDGDLEYISKFQVTDIDHLRLVPLSEALPGEMVVIARPGLTRRPSCRSLVIAICILLMFFSIGRLVSGPKTDGLRSSILKL